MMRKPLLLITIFVLPLLTLSVCEAQVDRSTQKSKLDATVVAGSQDDFMLVKHVRLAGTQMEIGKQFYELALEHEWQPAAVSNRARFDARLNYLKINWPAQYERIQGIATAMGEDLATTRLDLIGLGYQEVVAGCSCFYLPPKLTNTQGGIFSRNFDFTTGAFNRQPVSATNPPACSRPYIIETRPSTGYATLSVVCYDLLGVVDGINSEGLTVALLADDEIMSNGFTPSPEPKAGLGVVEVPRFLLETCATVEEAKRALYQAKLFYRSIPCHYLVADRFGNSFVWENRAGMNDGVAFDGKGDLQITTNFMIHLHEDELDSLPKESAPWGSFNRYCKVRDLVKKQDGPITVEDSRQIAGAVAANFEAPQGATPGRTLWHSVYDLEKREMAVSFYLGENDEKQTTSSTNGKYPRTAVRRTEYLKFQLQQP